MKHVTSVHHGRRHLLGAVLPGILLILTLLLPNLAVTGPTIATAATPAFLAVSPGSGAPNSPLTVSGSNFISNSQVTVGFTQMIGGHSENTTLAFITLPGGAGGFGLSTAIPIGAQPGPATITASDAQGDNASAAFTVNQPMLTLVPSNVVPLGAVTAAGSNFGANEVINITVNAAVFTVTASATGTFSTLFAAPAGIGSYPVTATGMSTGFQASATLNVQPSVATSTSTVAPPTATSTGTPLPTNTSTPLPTSTGTPLPTGTATPLLTATNPPVPPTTSTPLPTAQPTPCTRHSSSCAPHFCPRGKHVVHGRCVRYTPRARIIVKIIVVRHPPIRRHR